LFEVEVIARLIGAAAGVWAAGFVVGKTVAWIRHLGTAV